MARAFRPVGGAYVAQLDAAESRLVGELARDVLQMLRSRAELTGDLVPDDADPAGVVGPPPAGGTGSAGAESSGGAAGATGEDWWSELGLSTADLGLDADGQLLPDNAAYDVEAARTAGEDGAGTPGVSTRRRARPADPALARLLPDLVGADADPGEAERLRALTEPGIAAAKRAALAEAGELLAQNPLRVPAESAPRFASALNDIRLVLAQRLGIETEEDAARVSRLEDDDEEAELEHYLALLYGFVSWLQESLMTALLRRRR